MNKITTIILDLGGVILNLDQDRTISSFKNLGIDIEELHAQTNMFNDFEKGKISETEFRKNIRKLCKTEISDDEIDQAWNSMLLDLPQERIDILKDLKSEFNIYLLSNTNSIHIRDFLFSFNTHFKKENWNDLFHKIYYSHEVGLRKPDAEIYEFVLKDISAKGDECVFIDDNRQNLAGAGLCEIHTIWAEQPLSYFTVDKIYEIAESNY